MVSHPFAIYTNVCLKHRDVLKLPNILGQKRVEIKDGVNWGGAQDDQQARVKSYIGIQLLTV